MQKNIFKNLDDSPNKKKIEITEEEKQAVKANKVVKNIKQYVKIRIEMGIFEPIELTDAFNMDIFIAIQLPKDLDFRLNGKIVHGKEKDYIVFDFNDNIYFVKFGDFGGAYKFSTISAFQQLLSAIRLFDIKDDAKEIFTKIEYNKNLRGSENKWFGRLTTMIMNGNVDQEYIEAYKAIMEKKYKNELINYTFLSDFKASYLAKKLSQKKIPFALISPLVDSIVVAQEGEFDVDNIIKASAGLAMMITLASAAAPVASCIMEMNNELSGKASSVDIMSLDELIGFKSQLATVGATIPGINCDKVVAQMQQEAMEEGQIYGEDVLTKDVEDIFR